MELHYLLSDTHTRDGIVVYFKGFGLLVVLVVVLVVLVLRCCDLMLSIYDIYISTSSRVTVGTVW
jgi:hypothetical protein